MSSNNDQKKAFFGISVSADHSRLNSNSEFLNQFSFGSASHSYSRTLYVQQLIVDTSCDGYFYNNCEVEIFFDAMRAKFDVTFVRDIDIYLARIVITYTRKISNGKSSLWIL